MTRRTIALALPLLLAAACANPNAKPDAPASTSAQGDEASSAEQTAASEAEREPIDLPLQKGSTASDEQPGEVLKSLRAEVDRSKAGLSDQEHPPYYISYQVTEEQTRTASASFGAIRHADDGEKRIIDVDVRVGSYQLDNTHELRGEWFGDYGRSRPLGGTFDSSLALRRMLWRSTDHYYKKAAERFIKVKANHGVKAPEQDQSADFTRGPKITHVEPRQTPSADLETWKKNARRLSGIFSDFEHLQSGSVTYSEDVQTRYQVTSEGASVRKVRRVARVAWYAQATADDGQSVRLYDSVDVFDPDNLPPVATLEKRIRETAERVEALRTAKKSEPFVGPAILEGEAAGVFFHEALGHRVEGHRQADEDEGQTFAEKLGEEVLPPFLDVYDDPQLERAGGVPLMGHYRVDDQAVPAQRANIVDGGVLEGFLMSRTPVRGGAESNGHGRRQAGKHVVSRQGNLVVHPSKVVSREKLKQKLIEKIEEQDVPYGLRFVRVQGGFTLTGRRMPQSFKVLPLVVYRVYPDGREELVRGVNLEGTPLTVLNQIEAAADDLQVFNGVCGAESGHVPVSSVSPTLLINRVETARAPKGSDRPPILSPPPKKPTKEDP